MNLRTKPYLEQSREWPTSGRTILAQYDAESIIVYQAYRPSIGHFAASNGFFGGEFKLTRMSWIKPNFLWMMYRCGWASKEGQEAVLAIRLLRTGFDEILRQAVVSSYDRNTYASRHAWKESGANSDVRMQWDPDHAPNGTDQERRAIQLGLRGPTLKMYARDWIVDIEDITEFVHNQSQYATSDRYDLLQTPIETVYPVHDDTAAKRLRVDHR